MTGALIDEVLLFRGIVLIHENNKNKGIDN
jgi:hypothetical protein